MRVLLGWTLALGLVVSPAMAGTDSAGGVDSAKPARASTSAGVTAKADAPAKTDASSLESEIDELRSVLQSQASQLQEQNDQLKKQQEQMQALEERLKATNAGRESLSAAPSASPVATAPTPTTATPTLAAASTPQPVNAAPAPQNDSSPLQIKIGNATIIPIGFMDFTGEYRSRNAGNGIGTNFAGIPYNFTNAAGVVNLVSHTNEARLSMQNSRIGFRVDGLFKGAHVIGYMEADFLGNNAGTVAVTSNSNTLRSRLYWVDITKSKWEVLGGQTWSLITPGRVGISPIPGNIFFSQDIDVNYQAGLVWGRIPEFRFVFHPSSKAAIAFALDNQEQYVGGANGAPTIVLPTGSDIAGGVAVLPGSQLNNGATTQSAPQLVPDVIAKVALDPSPKFHVEFGGVERQFHVVVNSGTGTTGAANATPVVSQHTTGGGVLFNLNVQLFNGFRLLTNNFWSQGGGRYIFGSVPDVVVHPNGSLTNIEASSTVSGFEYTHKNTLLYAYYGGIYVNKSTFIDPTVGGNTYGYGVPIATNYGTAISQNRSIQEGTIGFNQTLWRDAKYGAVNLMGQYSYLTRDPWATAAGQPDNANLHMAFFNLRYTLPGAAPAMSDLK